MSADMPRIYTLVSGTTTLNSIKALPSRFVRPFDKFLITDPTPINISNDNSIAEAIHAAYPSCQIGLRTFGITTINEFIAAGTLSPLITALSYIYEDRSAQGDEAEYSTDQATTITNLATFATAARNAGYEAWCEPTGQGLYEREITPDHDYGLLAAEVDLLLIQSQRNAKQQSEGTDADRFSGAVSQVETQMADAEITDYSMQISIGSDTNSIATGTAAYDIFEEVLAVSTVPRLHLWPQQSNIDDYIDFLTQWFIRTDRQGMAVRRRNRLRR